MQIYIIYNIKYIISLTSKGDYSLFHVRKSQNCQVHETGCSRLLIVFALSTIYRVHQQKFIVGKYFS